MNSILAEIRVYLDTSGMAQSVFGLKAVGDPNLVRRLRNGGDIRMRTAERIRKFIKDNQSSRSVCRQTGAVETQLQELSPSIVLETGGKVSASDLLNICASASSQTPTIQAAPKTSSRAKAVWEARRNKRE